MDETCNKGFGMCLGHEQLSYFAEVRILVIEGNSIAGRLQLILPKKT